MNGGFSENTLFVLMEMVDTEILILGHCSKLKIHETRKLINDDTISAYLHTTCIGRQVQEHVGVKITIIVCRGQEN